MIRFKIGLWIATLSAIASLAAAPPLPPRALDKRLVFERIAAEPEIVTPTGIAIDRKGRLLVVESHTHFRPNDYQGPPADRIRVFEDENHDGRPECTGSFFEGTEKTMNLAVADDGAVWVATRSAIYRLEDANGDGRADRPGGGKLPEPLVRLDTKGDYPHNGLSGFAFDAAGKVYFGLGENLGADYRLIGRDQATLSGGGEGGSIYRCQPDGNGLERIATGFWNPFHMAVDVFGRLFAVDNDPDSRPPCRLLHIVNGGDFGYRFRNGRRGTHPFTAWNGELPGTLGMVAGTGEAPSGIVAYESDQLPDIHRGTLLVTSWGDHRIDQFRLAAEGASFRSVSRPVVVGGDDFRPVGIATAADGSVYVTDWVDKSYSVHGKGRIWRLRAADRAGAAAAETVPAGSLEARSEAITLATLAAAGKLSGPALAPFVKAGSADVRAMAAGLAPAVVVDGKGLAATDPSPLVRAEALRRLADPAAKDLLLKALESDDPFIQQAARQGLRHSVSIDGLVALAGVKTFSARQRLGLLLIVRDSGKPAARALVAESLADADPLIHFAAIEWVGEERLGEFRPQLLSGLGRSAVTKTVFEATLAALERLDDKVRGPREEVSGEEYIAALVSDRQTPARIVERGLRMLRPDHPALTLERLGWLMASRGSAVAIEAVRTLAQGSLPGRFVIMATVATDRNAPAALRAEAIAGLANDASGRREVLLELATGGQAVLRREALRSLRGAKLSAREIGLVRDANKGDGAAIELLDRLIGATTMPAVPAATDIDGWLALLQGPADIAAGERVFFHSKGPGCYRCHQEGGRGGRAGPDLSTLSAGMDRRRLVESILTPGKEIAPQYVAWNVATTDGTVFTGILLDQTPEGSLVFADAQGRLTKIKADLIAERKPLTTSIMPDQLALSMTVQEFRDVLAFLLGRK